MAGKVEKSSFVLLSKFVASRQESTSKTATSHIRKTLQASMKPNARSSTFGFSQHKSQCQKPKELALSTRSIE